MRVAADHATTRVRGEAMLKARSGDSLIFGLSEENLTRLKQGLPISIDLTEMGMKGRVLIFYGPTENDLAHELLNAMSAPPRQLNG
jgi:hypothetical protein